MDPAGCERVDAAVDPLWALLGWLCVLPILPTHWVAWEWCQTMKYLLQEVEGLGAGELLGPREAAVTLHLLMLHGKLELGEPGQDTSPALGSAAGDRGGQTHSAAWAGCWE